MTYPARPMQDRFWEKVDCSGECWLWTGAKTLGGYGKLMVSKGRFKQAHRYSYELFGRGPIPPGFQIDHLCETPACVNPAHLEAVTPVVNSRRASRGKAARTHCPAGHPYDEANTYMTPRGSRNCRACGRITAARRRHGVPEAHLLVA